MSARTPLALVGAACRLPGGVDSLDRLATFVLSGEDAVGPPPSWRGFDSHFSPEPGKPGRTCQILGGYLDGDLRDADPSFSELNPREAASLDPQQRLLLEVSWQALEHAGAPPERLAAGRTGVWVGVSGSEFRSLAQRRDASTIDAWIGTGTQSGVASGRLAYTFGTTGPAISVDTACSSSLTAFHLACRALWAGEVDTALVAGVGVLLDAEASVVMSAMGTLSPTGRCHTFSSRADGYVRGEGCVAVLLRRVPEPEDRVLAWIEGTACNHDGRSHGLTAPNPIAQRALMAEALAEAGLSASDIDYHEAHGTGTALGDAVELTALGAVHAGRAAPLPIGTLKASMGHLEAASGLAGLLRALVVARSGRLPPQLHAEPPCETLLRLPVLRVGAAGEPLSGRRVSVSSFGLGGTNAHVVLRAAEPPTPEPDPEEETLLLVSASSAGALRELCARTAEVLERGTPLGALSGTLARGRKARRERVAVVARRASEAARELRIAVPHRVDETPRTAWMFAGQGSGVVRGLGLARVHPAARDALERVFAAADPLLPSPLADALRDPAQRDTRFLQVGVFAVSWALSEVYWALGARPDVVVGHSSGEVGAACRAGVLSVEDAVRLLVARGEALHRSGPGGMVAVVAPPEALELPPGPVGLAALNHPAETVLSGPLGPLAEVVAGLRARGLVVREVDHDRAGHSVLLEPHLPELEAVVATLTLRPPELDFVSTATGRSAGSELLSPATWARQLRVPVRFGEALATVAGLGVGVFVELGPHPVLSAAVAAVVPGALAVRGLHRDDDERTTVLRRVGELWVAGVPIAAGGLLPAHRTAEAPFTPHERRRLWPIGMEGARRASRHVVDLVPLELPADGTAPVGERIVVPERASAVEATRFVALALAECAARPSPPRVWVVVPDEPLIGAAVSGVARCAWAEAPALGVSLLPTADPATTRRLQRLPRGVTVVRRPDGGLAVARWRTLDDPPSTPFRTQGTWVVTGGHGALGARTAAWLRERGAERVWCVGRTCSDPDDRADVSRPEDVARVLAAAGPSLVGVVHAAGVVHDQPLAMVDDDAIREVFAGKVDGALNLERALADRPEVHLVAFGSLASVLGGRGQGAYSAANAVLTAIGERRRRAGGRAVTLHFGPWAGGGLAEATNERRRAEGFPPMSPEAAMAALEVTLVEARDVVIADLDPARRGHHPLLDGGDGRSEQVRVPPDHVLDGRAILSGADQLVAALRLADGHALADVRFVRRVPLVAGAAVDLEVVVRGRELTLRVDGEVATTARLADPSPFAGSAASAKASCPVVEDVAAMLGRFERQGLVLGPGRRRLRELRSGPGRWFCELDPEGDDGARLDACLLPSGEQLPPGPPAVPVSVARVTLTVPMSQVQAALLVRTSAPGADPVTDLTLFDGAGRAVGALVGFTGLRGENGRATPSTREDPLSFVLSEAAALLGRPSDAPPLRPDQDLADLGFDSMMGVDLRNRVAARGWQVPLHLVVGAATPAEIAAAIRGPAASAPPEPVVAGTTGDSDDPDAVTPLHSHLAAAFVGAVLAAGVLELLGWVAG